MKKSKIQDFNACDDFLKITVKSYIVAAGMKVLNMATMDDEPDNASIISGDAWLQDEDTRRDTLYAVASKIVDTLIVDLEVSFASCTTDMRGYDDDDKVLEYSRLVISLRLLYMEYCDAIREGDGTRVLRCWRYNFLVFKSTNRKNYAIEALYMLVQYHFIFSKRQAHQLLWGRFVNVHGLPARNIPCDLYMEHLNRVCKEAIRGLKANKIPNAITRVGRIVGILDSVVKSFDEENSVPEKSGNHKVASYNRDVNAIVKILVEEKSLTCIPKRFYPSFPNIIRNPIRDIEHESLLSYMYMHLNNIIHGF